MDNLAKIYVKFYICQIHCSISYPQFKKTQQNYEEIIGRQFEAMNEDNNNNDVNMEHNDPKAIPMPMQVQTQSVPNVLNTQSIKPNDDDEKEKFPKKLFVFKNKIFSRVEIQGLIVQIQIRGNEDNSRKIVYVDDTTGIIQVIIWKNKMINTFDQIDKLFGSYIRVLGQVDFFSEKFEIVADRIQQITKCFNEILFHTTMQNNQKSIFNISINQLLQKAFEDINNTSIAIPKTNPNPNSKSKSNIESQSIANSSNSSGSTKYIELLKEYSNRLLGCFEGFYLNGFVEDSYGFTKIPIKLFMNNTNLTEMLKDFCGLVYDTNKFLMDSFALILEPQMLGKIIYEGNDTSFLSSSVEIKSNNSKIKNEIYGFIKRKNEENEGRGAVYSEIYQYISSLHNNFYTHDYLKFIITKMTDNDMQIISLGSNCYSINN